MDYCNETRLFVVNETVRVFSIGHLSVYGWTVAELYSPVEVKTGVYVYGGE